MLDPTEICT